MSPLLPSPTGLPRFGLDPDQHKELARLKRENHPAYEQVRYVFEHDEPLPVVDVYQCYAPRRPDGLLVDWTFFGEFGTKPRSLPRRLEKGEKSDDA